jgi:protein involved in polysaccharide export with SLBB domain
LVAYAERRKGWLADKTVWVVEQTGAVEDGNREVAPFGLASASRCAAPRVDGANDGLRQPRGIALLVARTPKPDPLERPWRPRVTGRAQTPFPCYGSLAPGVHRILAGGLVGMGYGMNRAFVRSAALVVALLISGCTASSLSEAEQQSLAAAAVAAPKLQPGDKIRINVYGEDKLSGDYEIDQSGQISLPLAGTIEAVGLTQTELEQALAKKFRSEYLKNPKVTVTIATLRPFYMMGEVTKPGEYPYKSGLNILTALAIAGGPTYRASRNTVQIQRRGETSMREYPISASVPILPGDVIRVPERYF